MKNNLKIEIGSTEAGHNENATLHQASDNLACSIAVHPTYPRKDMTQDEVAAYLKKLFEPLHEMGVDVSIEIGSDVDSVTTPEFINEKESTVYDKIKNINLL